MPLRPSSASIKCRLRVAALVACRSSSDAPARGLHPAVLVIGVTVTPASLSHSSRPLTWRAASSATSPPARSTRSGKTIFSSVQGADELRAERIRLREIARCDTRGRQPDARGGEEQPVGASELLGRLSRGLARGRSGTLTARPAHQDRQRGKNGEITPLHPEPPYSRA